MNKLDQIKTLEEKIADLEYDFKQLGFDLQDNADEIKETEAKIQTPYSVGVNLVMIFISIAITGGGVTFLLKWWISTHFSVFVGLLLLVVTIISLLWDIFAIATSTRKNHNKTIAEYQNKLTTLLNEKEEIIANRYAIKNEINAMKNAINDIKALQKREEEERKRALEEEEKKRREELEVQFQQVINNEKIDRNKLNAIADAGHTNAKIEMAKILIDDYFSDMYTSDEKKQIIKEAQTNIEGINTDKDAELELLSLFSYTMYWCVAGSPTMKENLKRIREIKWNNTLSKKYDSLATKMIQHIVSVIEDDDRRWEERQRARDQENNSYNYSTSIDTDSSSSALCAHYQNGSCKRGRNAYYDNISCGYSECFQSVCPNYQKR